MKRVLFLCTGNYYRSRFAEIFFNWHAEQSNLAWRAESRGLALDARNPGPISSYTVSRLKSHLIPFEKYLRAPAPLSESDLDAANHVIAVKADEHEPLVRQKFPGWLDRVEFWRVDDLDCATADEALPHLEREVIDLLRRLETAPDFTAA